MEQQQETQSPEAQFVERFQAIEDRLVLASLPVLIFCFVLWAIATAYPGVATVINLIITILVLLISCVVILRLVEIAWQWATNNDPDDSIGAMGAVGIGLMLLFGVVTLIDAIMHAGIASASRGAVMGFLLAILALQYRAIILRWMKK